MLELLWTRLRKAMAPKVGRAMRNHVSEVPGQSS